jgi:hypothetical protein
MPDTLSSENIRARLVKRDPRLWRESCAETVRGNAATTDELIGHAVYPFGPAGPCVSVRIILSEDAPGAQAPTAVRTSRLRAMGRGRAR